MELSGRLRNRQTREIAKFDQFGHLGLRRGQAGQRLIKRKHIVGRCRRGDGVRMERLTPAVAAVFGVNRRCSWLSRKRCGFF